MPSHQILRKFRTPRYLFTKHPSEVSQTSRFSSIHKLGKLVNYKPKYFSDRLAILNKHRIFQTVRICQTPRYLFLKHPYPAAGYLDTAFSIHAIQLLGWIRAATILFPTIRFRSRYKGHDTTHGTIHYCARQN